jgi:hypothetical protein
MGLYPGGEVTPMSDLDLILDYLMHQWLPVEVREAYKRLLQARERDA